MTQKVALIQRGDPHAELTIAKTILVREQYFYFELLNACQVTMGSLCDTAGVRFLAGGMVELYINPEFFLSLTVYERVGLLMHEMLHIMYNHPSRSHGFDSKRSNVAMDNVINQLIPTQFLPAMGITPEKLSRDLNMDIAKDKTFEEYYVKLKECENQLGDYNKKPKDEDGEESQKSSSDSGTGKQRGKSGAKVLDEHSFWETGVTNEEINKKTIEQMAKTAKENTLKRNNGDKSIPKDLIDDILEQMQPEKIGWRVVLRQFTGARVTSERRSTYNRPNRMLGLKAPGKKGGCGPGILWGIDDSGSITDENILTFMYEAYGATKIFSENSQLVFFDSDLHRDEKGEPKVFQIGGNIKPPGRPQTGGTDFQPLIDYANQVKPDVLVIFTDGVAGIPTTPKCPVLWILLDGYDNPALPGKRILLPPDWDSNKTTRIIG